MCYQDYMSVSPIAQGWSEEDQWGRRRRRGMLHKSTKSFVDLSICMIWKFEGTKNLLVM